MLILQNDTTPILFFMSLASDVTGRTPATGLTPAVTLSKAGAAFAAAAGAVAEISSGWYKLTPTAADTGTLGDLAIRATAATADDWNDLRRIVTAVRTDLATELGRIDVATSSRLPTASYTAPDNATIGAIAGYVDTEVAAIKARTDLIPAAPAAVSNIPTAAAVAAAVLAAAAATPVAANVEQVNAVPLAGAGTLVDPWRPV